MPDTTQRNEPTLEKTEAIRRAVEALGYHAPVSQILEYMRDRFGIGVMEGAGAAPVTVAADEGDVPKPAGKRGKNRPND